MCKMIALFILSASIAMLPCVAVAHDEVAHQPLTKPAATQSAGPLPNLTLAMSTEEGKKVLTATVQLQGKPLAGAKVIFLVQRTFGLLPVGEDETLEDGTAAVPFPSDLPGGPSGKLDVIVRIKTPEAYAAACAEAALDGGVPVPGQEDPFPPALWAPHAPLGLILTIVILLGFVWSTFTYVILQLRKLRKEARHETN